MTAHDADADAQAEADQQTRRVRRRRIAETKQHLRNLRIELALLNNRVGARAELRITDLDSLDIIVRDGPLSPTALARRTGVHLATMTGILDRLEKGGWITRDRVETDRRAVLVSAAPERQRSLFELYGGMNDSLDAILDDYSDEQIDVISGFLGRCAEAGQAATRDLAKDGAE
ncbi:MAG TPA: MarR family transcriptional regulator [Actinocrinis sp.]|nr:MarR family transcriptional regulator [Actinocrinis sp.]